MLQTWRWFGPEDVVSVDDMLQAGAEAVVTALHHVAAGAVWTPEDIAERQRDLATMANGMASGMAWVVAESLPVSENIKKQKATGAHLGVGAFHRAHQANNTDAALAAAGGDWRIVGISLRSSDAADMPKPQNGLYSVIGRGDEGVGARLIGSIARVVAARRDPAIRIVNLTVTEEANGIDLAEGCVVPAAPPWPSACGLPGSRQGCLD